MSNDKEQFKAQNLRNWERNSDYWINNPLRQVEDTKLFFVDKLWHIVEPHSCIIDMGCGNAWLLDCLLELSVPFRYIGLDFNPVFITHLERKYSHLKNASFELLDLENSLPSHLMGGADLVFNCFNFFETLDLGAVFGNAASMLKKDGLLVVFTIDPIYLILAVSKSMQEFRDMLGDYEMMKIQGGTLHFFQNIDLGDRESKELKYASVLYSLDDFFREARSRDMRLVDYGEVVKTSKPLPKTYQYIVFAK